MAKAKEQAEPKKAPEEKPVKMKTVYTHNKKYEIPIDKPIEEFLKEKFPQEYK